MKKLKKFKRYAEGGALGAGEGDPFSYTDFSNRERNLRKPSEAAPIEEAKPYRVSKPEVRETKPEPTKAEPARAPTPSGRREIPPTPLTKAEERADSDQGAESSSVTIAGDAKKAEKYRQSLMPVSKPKPKPPAPAAQKTPEPSSKPSYVGAGDSDDSVETKKKNELERLQRVGSGAVEQTMMGPAEIALFGAMGGIPSKVRAGLGMARKAYDEFNKPAAKPAEKSEPKLDSKAEPKQGQLFDEAGQPTPAALGKPAPKEAPKAEPKAETKSGAIQPTGKGPSEAGRKAMEGSKGSLKEQAKEAINKQRAADKDPRGALSTETKSGAIQPTGKGPSEAGRKLMENANRPAGPQRPSLKEQALDAVNKQRAADKDPRGPVSGAIQPTGRGPSEAGSKLMREAGGNKPKGPERLPLKEQAVDAINKQRASDKDSRGPLLAGSRPARPAPWPDL